MLRSLIRNISYSFVAGICLVFLLPSCSMQKRTVARSAKEDVLNTPALSSAHVGITIFDPASGKYLFDHQGEKYFVPASNTKIPTCYSAMKFLGDSLVGLKYVSLGGAASKDIWIQATGDPTLLHPDFPKQPVIDFLRKDTSINFVLAGNSPWRDEAYGSGWSWNDYADDYMAERSVMPVYGNVIRFYGSEAGMNIIPRNIELGNAHGNESTAPFVYSSRKYSLSRTREKNLFLWESSTNDFKYQEIPFITSQQQSVALLKDSLRGLRLTSQSNITLTRPKLIHTQPTDSLLSLMMHRSDNFFAEQSLLMVSNEELGYMNDASIIDTLLKSVFRDLPQQPRWVDGSGLSRYNLFSPRDLVFILDKIRKEFGMERVKAIFPTGDKGTLRNYYKAEQGSIYAKTGTLAGVVAISGYLYTRQNRLLLFSVLVNNHRSSATEIRRAVEKFIEVVWKKY